MKRQRSHEERFTSYIQSIFGTSPTEEEQPRDANESIFDSIYELSKEHGLSSEASKKYRVYEPKTSSEYWQTMMRHPLTKESESFAYKVARGGPKSASWHTNLPMEQDRYRLSFDARRFQVPDGPHNFVIDYSGAVYPKTYKSIYKPLSRQLYAPRSNGYHNEDSRHLCSDFVMISVRKPGAWFDRVDRLLKEAKRRD